MLDGVSCVPQSTPKATAPRGGLHIEFRCVIFDRYSGPVREGRLSRLSRRFVGFVVQTSQRYFVGFVVQTSPVFRGPDAPASEARWTFGARKAAKRRESRERSRTRVPLVAPGSGSSELGRCGKGGFRAFRVLSCVSWSRRSPRSSCVSWSRCSRVSWSRRPPASLWRVSRPGATCPRRRTAGRVNCCRPS